MRNGNVVTTLSSSLGILVLTVPMRNGNTSIIEDFKAVFEFLPYL